MKNIILIFTYLNLGALSSQAALVRLDTAGSTTGDNLDGVSTVPTTVTVVEVAGLTLTVHAITGNGTGSELSATGKSLGIDAGAGGDDRVAFDASFNEAVTFSFNQAVSISQLDFSDFDNGDVFEFGSTVITFADLTATNSDVYDYSSPLLLAANEQFTIRATSGTVGIETMDLTVVPEPSSSALLGLGGLALILRHRS